MVLERYASAIQACNACAVATETCAAACLKEADVQSMALCISCDLDCAALCRLAVKLMARDSPLVDEVCRLCALACQACAEECGKHKHDHCQQCAQACLRCVEECESLAKGA